MGYSKQLNPINLPDSVILPLVERTDYFQERRKVTCSLTLHSGSVIIGVEHFPRKQVKDTEMLRMVRNRARQNAYKALREHHDYYVRQRRIEEDSDIFVDQEKFLILAEQKKKELAPMYGKLVAEEAAEFAEALEADSHYEQVKEAIDVIYVSAGFLNLMLGSHGAKVAWDIVQDANMQKFDPFMERREDGKIMKSQYYVDYVKPEAEKKMKDLVDNVVVL